MNNSKLIPFDKLANDEYFPPGSSPMEALYWTFDRKKATAEERAYIKTLKPDKLIEYLEKRNNEEFLERL